MKKLLVVMVLVISILSACNSTKISFKEVENIPDNVQEQIDSSIQLQLIEVGKNTSYVVFLF